ncbi:MAG: hypothetical protein JRJ45_02770 [Deltaproteobacteria bacterium]|nr:hypothetical protein [Deltaproteobacteria bacterium]
MNNKLVGTEKTISKKLLYEKDGLPEILSQLFEDPDEWIREQEAFHKRNENLLAEHDELIQYVKALKMLAVYLTDKNNMNRENLSGMYFEKAEEQLPEDLRKEIGVG